MEGDFSYNLWSSYGKQAGLTETFIDQWWAVVLDKYTERQRHYHTIKHVDHMCSLLDKYKDHIMDKYNVCNAILFHDIIYNPEANDNEMKSEELFQTFAKEAKLKSEDTKAISDMIILTKNHSTEAHTTENAFGMEDHHYFIDFDMAILGSSDDGYKIYADQIRQEYIHVPEDVYRAVRPGILRSFLETPNIFATRELRAVYEEQSRRNIQSEIQRLENQ